MIKFLKFILFIVVIVFSFALGIKFSDSFKNNFGALKNDELKVQNEMNKAFDNAAKETNKLSDIQDNSSEMYPLTEEEKMNLDNANSAMPEFADIEVIDSIDTIEPLSNNTNPDMVNPQNSTENTQQNTNVNQQMPVANNPAVNNGQEVPVVPSQVNQPVPTAPNNGQEVPVVPGQVNQPVVPVNTQKVPVKVAPSKQ